MVRRVCAGFVRACVLTVVSMLVPALWTGAVLLANWWGGRWAWLPVILWAAVGTFVLSRPVCGLFRALVAKWTGTVIPGGYREAVPVTRTATGYWWNGSSYSGTGKEAREDQRPRLWWSDPATWRDLRFTAVAAATVGVPAAIPLAGVALAVLEFSRTLSLVAGLAVAVLSAPYVWQVAEPVAVRFLGASPAMALADRVDELTVQRADATVAQAAEIRRIERDLHDGAQARLVALGLSLATAEKVMETDPGRAKVLLREARAGAATSLTELRELVRGITPPVLNERGLVDAVRALALDSPLDVTVTADGDQPLDAPIESAVYFGVAELVTNAAKHAHANWVGIAIVRHDTGVVVDVEDDGRGGVHEGNGGGLAGLRRRLAVFDGTVDITSPAGGPTRVRMAVPCASS